MISSQTTIDKFITVPMIIFLLLVFIHFPARRKCDTVNFGMRIIMHAFMWVETKNYPVPSALLFRMFQKSEIESTLSTNSYHCRKQNW